MNGVDPRVIEPGRIRVVLLREVVPADNAGLWSCTRCRAEVHPADSLWLGYETSSSDTPFVVPLCRACAGLFRASLQVEGRAPGSPNGARDE